IFKEDTFIPKKQRIFAILQLCATFWSILFALSWPFMGQYFEAKSQIFLFEYVKGEKNQELKEYFKNIPQSQQSIINTNYLVALQAFNLSFLDKLQDSFKILFFKLSIYERAWIFFGILIPIFLLKKREGAKEASLILPLIALAFLLNNQIHIKTSPPTEGTSLYPTEEFLEKKYLNEPLRNLSLKEQQENLLKAWQLYLIDFFLNETPSKNLDVFEKQILKAEHAFQTARAVKIKPPLLANKKFDGQEPLFLLIAYLVWNTLFSITMLNTPRHPQKIQEVPAN
ncbi:MAG TPA: hypothetical protein PLC42_05520, partial [Parachlamydiaceae bacterium]|nr:hypothetical protein [Parachlamydiaceae bacterium]